MLRRSFLRLLGGAPIALPAVAKAALAPEPFSSTIFVDVDWADYGRRCAAYFDANPELYPTDLSGQTYGDVAALRVDPASVAAAARQERAGWAARGLDQLPAAMSAPFTDDVGSGP